MHKVSVIIPVYNHEEFISECIESVLSQTYRNFEIVVVDDGSTDRTPDILVDFKDKIKYIRQKNNGGAAALNTAVKNSTGDYIAWLSSDDLFMPAKLEAQIDFFDKNLHLGLIYTDFYIIDFKGKIIKEVHSPYYEDKRQFLYYLFISNFINGSSVMFKRECIEKIGYFDEEMKYHADGNAWFRMLKYFRFGHIPQLLLKYRWHTANLSHHFVNMKRYYYPYYKKIFAIYKPADFFPEGCLVSDAYFYIATILEKQRIYSLAFSKLFQSIKLKPTRLFAIHLLLSFVLRLPLLLMIDLGVRLFSWIERHSHNQFIYNIHLKLCEKTIRRRRVGL